MQTNLLALIPNIELTGVDKVNVGYSSEYNVIPIDFKVGADTFSIYFETTPTGKINLFKNGQLVWQK